ncbi:zinc ribbon domain-containing protein [Deferribacter autotrophicus]|uniref:Zinc ribbon domain-containing protein n=1 Tax=Deferribacter autotrophicus TaxID=500465 RepID=A0A5A8F8Y4_9BACT|nr:FmdB family zinc ribbon protein [Deferribacter autotrophicus]KAA0259207.1 zinc ribbon domain-containing protein [Deferribacter autotrophicus]
MPIYEYKCKECGNVFELMESINSDVYERKCVKCGGTAKRIISLSSFHLKGSGWYVTDYKNNKGSGSKTKSENTSCGSGSKEACSTCAASQNN